MESIINKMALENFSELAAARDHYYSMIENLKVTMLDGLKKIPKESFKQRDEYMGYITVIEMAFDRKMQSFDVKIKSKFVA